MKPDWSSKNVPEWAQFAAQEPSGAWYFYEFRPTYSELCTEWQTKGRREIIPKVELAAKDTLEERPIGRIIVGPEVPLFDCDCDLSNLTGFVGKTEVPNAQPK